MRSWIATALLVSAALAGCAEETPSYELRGTFTEEASEEQMDELRQEVEDRGGEIAFLESFPVQFHATDLAEEDCEEVRSFAQDAEYVREVGDCEVAQDTEDGDEGTSNGT